LFICACLLFFREIKIFHENIPTTTKQKDNDENEDTNVVDTVFFFAIDLQQTEYLK